MTGTLPCFASCARRRAVKTQAWILPAAALLLAFGSGGAATAFDSGRAAFSVRVNAETIPYRVFAVYTLPGEGLDVAVSAGSPPAPYRMQASSGEAVTAGVNRWLWRAPPQPGVARLRIDSGTDAIDLNVVVMHPAVELRDGRLNAYRIGYYPVTALRENPIYLPPRGFIELGEHSGSLQLSPHFQLWQFPAKQAGGPPKYLVLRERLLLKLELLLERLNAEGRNAETFTIMSGYRTPSYNAALGNVEYSRHVYGGAADIFVDSAPRDGIMDDLNRDGVTDYHDAQWLYRLANDLFSASKNRALLGGLGVYRSTSAHGPFLHVDARGTRARWGFVP